MKQEIEAAEEILSEGSTAAELLAGKILLVEIDVIQPNQYNPNEMSEEEFKALVENMKREGPHGTDPLLVRPLDKGFELIDGEHRHRSAQQLGWEKIRVTVRKVDEHRAQEINYAKNRLRGHINPFKEADLFASNWKRLGTQEAVANKFEVSRQYVTDALSLLKIPDEVREKIDARASSRRTLRILATIDDPADQEKLAEKIGQGITVREAQTFASSLKAEVGSEPTSVDTGLPTSEPTKVPKKTRKKKAKYHCDFCGPRLDGQFHEVPGRGLVCNTCSRDVEVVAKPVKGEEAVAPPTEEIKETEKAVKPVDLEAKGCLCPVCGRVVSEALYERLKTKYVDYEGLF